MKQTNQSATGTSFHSTIINASVEELKSVLGEPCYDENKGNDKVNYEWEMETDGGEVFTVYDWKHYRPISESEIIPWHIGGNCARITETAKIEILSALKQPV